MKKKKIFSFRYDFGKREKDTCVNSSGMNAIFDIPYIEQRYYIDLCTEATVEMLCNFIEIARQHGCSPVNLLHILRTPFLKETSGRLLLFNFQIIR